MTARCRQDAGERRRTLEGMSMDDFALTCVQFFGPGGHFSADLGDVSAGTVSLAADLVRAHRGANFNGQTGDQAAVQEVLRTLSSI